MAITAKDRKLISDIYDHPVWTGEATAIELPTQGSHAEQKTALFERILASARLSPDEASPFADKLEHGSFAESQRAAWFREVDSCGELGAILAATSEDVRARRYSGDCDFGHTVPEWDRLLARGIPGIIEDIRAARAAHVGLTPDQKEYYDCAERAWLAFLGLCRRYSAAVGSMSGRYSEKLRGCLDALASGAPETGYEALELMLLYYELQTNIELTILRSFGRLDSLLLPFYERDLSSGRASREDWAELIAHFFLRLDARHVGANIPFVIGPEPNELTYLMLDVYDSLDIYSPKLQVLVSGRTPREFIKRVLRSIRDGRSSFVFINDELTVASLERLGAERADAERYGIVGCYEPCALGEIPCTCNGIVNIPMALLEAVQKGGCDDFESFYTSFESILRSLCERSEARISAWERVYPRLHCSPLFSPTISESLRRGADVYSGGAKYNSSSINAIGLATAADSLAAVKKLVYDEKRVSLDRLAEILASDWSGEEALRLEAKTRFPKYGDGDKSADDLARRIVGSLDAAVNNRPNGRGGVFRLGLFSIDWVFQWGEATGATPDGRHSGEMLSKNLCATVSCDRRGSTAYLNGASSVSPVRAPNGAVADLLIHPSAASGERGLEALCSMILTFFADGGTSTHINVVDSDTLRAAMDDPDKYRTLQIRVCGWNAYFVSLPRDQQQSFIKE